MFPRVKRSFLSIEIKSHLALNKDQEIEIEENKMNKHGKDIWGQRRINLFPKSQIHSERETRHLQEQILLIQSRQRLIRGAPREPMISRGSERSPRWGISSPLGSGSLKWGVAWPRLSLGPCPPFFYTPSSPLGFQEGVPWSVAVCPKQSTSSDHSWCWPGLKGRPHGEHLRPSPLPISRREIFFRSSDRTLSTSHPLNQCLIGIS